MLTLALAIVGVYALALWSYETYFCSLAGLIWGTLKETFFCRRTLAERYGKWAVITGATDGIGKGYAVNLARKGMNVVLISRTEAKLIKVSREIQDAYGVQVRRIVADFSQGAKIYPHIKKELADVEIGILVNNVGVAMDRLEFFEQYSENDYLQMVNVNMLSTLLMTHMVLPRMKQLRRGLIINVSSSSAYFSPPFLTMYAATKNFGHSLSLALQQELKGTGVELQLMAPQFVRTNMTDPWDVSRYGGPFLPDASTYGRWATWMIGKTSHSCGHWFHSLQLFGQRCLPSGIHLRILYYVFNDLRRQQNSPKVKKTDL